MRQITLCIFILAGLLKAHAQTDCHCNHLCECTISGVVTDLENNAPLPFASVAIKSTDKGVNADEEGKFTINNICGCVVTLQISYTGYKTKELTVHAEHPEFFNILLAPDTKLLESVIVLGEEKADRQISYIQSTVSSDRIEQMAGRSFGEMMTEINGVEMLQTGGNVAKPVIDGLNSNRILILNNGIRHEGQQWGAEHAPAIDPMLAQNIKVIRGAASVKYGAGALGGIAVVLPPKLPFTEHKIHGKLNLAGHSNGKTLLTSGLIEGEIKEVKGLAWRLQGTFKRGGDLHTPEYNLTNTGVSEQNFSVSMGKKDENVQHELFYSHFNTELGILKATGHIENTTDLKKAIKSDVPAGTESFSYQINAPKQEVTHNLVKLKSNISLDQNKLKIKYGFQHNSRKEFDIRRGNLVELPSIDLTLSSHLLDLEYINYDFHPHQLTLGINSSYQNNNNIAGTQTIPFIPNYNMYSTGIFFMDRRTSHQWTLELGIRGDYQNYNVAGRDFQNNVYRSNLDFYSISGLVGTKYIPDHNNKFRLNISSGWRPPHVAELYGFGKHQSAGAIEYGYLISEENNSVLGTTVKPVKNENSIKAALHYEHHKNHFHLNGSAFYQRLFNYYYLNAEGVTQGIRGAFPFFRYKTTDALFTGFDIKADYDVIKILSISAAYNFLYAKNVKSDDHFLFIPPSSLKGDLTFHLEHFLNIDHIDITGGGRYNFQQSFAPETINIDDVLAEDTMEEIQSNFDFLPPPGGQLLLHAEIRFQKMINNNLLEWRIAADNLLNERYKSYTNRLKYYANEKGRNFSIGIIYHF